MTLPGGSSASHAPFAVEGVLASSGFAMTQTTIARCAVPATGNNQGRQRFEGTAAAMAASARGKRIKTYAIQYLTMLLGTQHSALGTFFSSFLERNQLARVQGRKRLIDMVHDDADHENTNEH